MSLAKVLELRIPIMEGGSESAIADMILKQVEEAPFSSPKLRHCGANALGWLCYATHSNLINAMTAAGERRRLLLLPPPRGLYGVVAHR